MKMTRKPVEAVIFKRTLTFFCICDNSERGLPRELASRAEAPHQTVCGLYNVVLLKVCSKKKKGNLSAVKLIILGKMNKKRS